MNKINYQKELDKITAQIGEHCPEEKKPHLFLHCCCAPCGSYVLEYLAPFFRITVFYYNPNITPETEYQKRIIELKKFIRQAGYENQVQFREGNYEPEIFFEAVRGMEKLPERSIRCRTCYHLRMREAARLAAKEKADYFTTTLSLSPHKNADWINEIGQELQLAYGVKHLPSDFKKRGGYLRSIQLSGEYGLYRQNYCGCIFSKNETASKSNR